MSLQRAMDYSMIQFVMSFHMPPFHRSKVSGLTRASQLACSSQRLL